MFMEEYQDRALEAVHIGVDVRLRLYSTPMFVVLGGQKALELPLCKAGDVFRTEQLAVSLRCGFLSPDLGGFLL
jgi:hypothetical protein